MMTVRIGQIFKVQTEVILSHTGLPCCEAAVNLLAMIAAHESGGFCYVRQIGGPALGLLQMEPDSYTEIVAYAKRKKLFPLPKNAFGLIIDSRLAIIAARIFFLRIPEPLPAADDIKGLASYAKKYWNTYAGKAVINDYFNAYSEWCG